MSFKWMLAGIGLVDGTPGDVGTSEFATRILALPGLLRALAPTRSGVSVSLLCELPKQIEKMREISLDCWLKCETQTHDFYLACAMHLVMESVVRPKLHDLFAMAFLVDWAAGCLHSRPHHELVSTAYHLAWTFCSRTNVFHVSQLKVNNEFVCEF